MTTQHLFSLTPDFWPQASIWIDAMSVNARLMPSEGGGYCYIVLANENTEDAYKSVRGYSSFKSAHSFTIQNSNQFFTILSQPRT